MCNNKENQELKSMMDDFDESAWSSLLEIMESTAQVNTVLALSTAITAILSLMQKAAESFDDELGDSVIGWVQKEYSSVRRFHSMVARLTGCEGDDSL